MASITKLISPTSVTSPQMTVTLAGANAHSFKYQKKQLSSSNGRKNGVSGSNEPLLHKGMVTSNSQSNFLLNGGIYSNLNQKILGT